ncbi:hypothetical protein [Microvirga yunnanensis]|uniref:hypothetical protein n=1 Tax=Microvirga yunnanensis TaxID=2953740 RepID=UPI0021C8E715|nr:hypothetical protein [Microvirga sp. HBU65207]
MLDVFPGSNAPRAVAVLLHPSIVPVIDVFRSLDLLEDQYDLALLDGPEQGLTAYTGQEAAKGIVSDALLLAFALTRQPGGPFAYRPVGSRHGSLDEFCLLTLIASSRNLGSDLAVEAASLLDVASLDVMGPLTGEILRHMDAGDLVFALPSLPEFRAMMGTRSSEEVLVEAAPGKAERNLRH